MAFVDFDFPPHGGPSRSTIIAPVLVRPVADRSRRRLAGPKPHRLLLGLLALVALALIGSWATEALNSSLLGIVAAGVVFVSVAGVASSTLPPAGARRHRP